MLHLCAVLTGDVIQSEAGATTGPIAEHLHAAHERVQPAYAEAAPHPISVFRGDSWQLVVTNPAYALHIAVAFRVAVRRHAQRDTRVAIAVDTVDALDTTQVTQSTGPAFKRSGEMLDTLEKPYRMRCVVPESAPHAVGLAASALTDMADHLATHWTDAQAQAIHLNLTARAMNRTVSQRELAEQWHPQAVSQQAFSKHLQHAHWQRLEDALERYQALLSNTIPISI
ncbi:MAG: SatD family protein [Longimonas sp.]|uniref:SatD family protein n=1 Tax=Longimonas sp. TaxID=2039626 RepID=UPI0033542B22